MSNRHEPFRAPQSIQEAIDSPSAVPVDLDLFLHFAASEADAQTRAEDTIPAQVRIPVGFQPGDLPLVLALQVPEVSATGFMAWGYGALADAMEQDEELASLLLTLARDDQALKRWRALVDCHEPYDPATDLPRLAHELFSEGGIHHEPH